jgi:hypothetical protein
VTSDAEKKIEEAVLALLYTTSFEQGGARRHAKRGWLVFHGQEQTSAGFRLLMNSSEEQKGMTR